MTIKSIGLDVEEISRFAKNRYEEKKSFYEKIFTPAEIQYCLSKSNPYPHFTARFCAKEATVKALNNKRINFLDIEIKVNNNKPVIKICNEKNVLVSISHTREHAFACVIINE